MATTKACFHCKGEKTNRADQIAQLECGHWICEACLLARKKMERSRTSQIFSAVQCARSPTKVNFNLPFEMILGELEGLGPHGFRIKPEMITRPDEAAARGAIGENAVLRVGLNPWPRGAGHLKADNIKNRLHENGAPQVKLCRFGFSIIRNRKLNLGRHRRKTIAQRTRGLNMVYIEIPKVDDLVKNLTDEQLAKFLQDAWKYAAVTVRGIYMDYRSPRGQEALSHFVEHCAKVGASANELRRRGRTDLVAEIMKEDQ